MSERILRFMEKLREAKRRRIGGWDKQALHRISSITGASQL